MSLPAILAALARVAAPIAARVGAPAVARTLAGAARVAPAVARGAAAATTAASSSAAAPVSQAAGGMRVLENTKLTNARSLFQAIYGQSPPAAASTAAANVGASQIQSAASAPAASPAAAATPPATPPAAPPTPPAAPSPGSTPPSNPRPQTILDRAKDAWESTKRAYESTRARFEPVANQVRNLTLDQRYQRLQQAGRLLDPGAVGRQIGTPTPSREQHVNASEAEEERQRQQAVQQSRSAQVGQAAWNVGKKALFTSLKMTNPASMATAAATAPLWLYGIIKGFERLGQTISETNRDLVRFDERIADSFQRLDFQQLRSRQQMARATGGSASMLNEQLAALIREMQPIRESVTTFLNTAGSSIVFVARMAAFVLKWHPMFVAMHRTAQLAERFMGRGEAQEAQKAAKDFMRDIRDGKFDRPKVPPPRRR